MGDITLLGFVVSKYALSHRIEPGASPQPVFDCLCLLFAKVGWFKLTTEGCDRIEGAQTGLHPMIANGFEIIRPGKIDIHLRVP